MLRALPPPPPIATKTILSESTRYMLKLIKFVSTEEKEDDILEELDL